MKDVLKRRGYRWNSGDDGRPKAWWTEIDEEALEVERRFLQREVYLRDVELHCEIMTAVERYRRSSSLSGISLTVVESLEGLIAPSTILSWVPLLDVKCH